MSRPLSQFLDLGFHGDKYLIDLVFAAAKVCPQFVETGANVGSSLHYFAKHFPSTPCYSCEPDLEAFQAAQSKIAEFKNVILVNEPSPEFLYQREKTLAAQDTLFWLDAHGYGFHWPLKDEIAFITRVCRRARILIDDFQVPDQPQFSYDEYDGQVCGFGEIKDSLQTGIRYRLVYPCYTEKTSTFHPLRGWVLIEYGFDNPLPFPPSLAGKVRVSNWPPTGGAAIGS